MTPLWTCMQIAQVMNLLTENAEIAISEAACYVQVRSLQFSYYSVH